MSFSKWHNFPCLYTIHEAEPSSRLWCNIKERVQLINLLKGDTATTKGHLGLMSPEAKKNYLILESLILFNFYPSSILFITRYQQKQWVQSIFGMSKLTWCLFRDKHKNLVRLKLVIAHTWNDLMNVIKYLHSYLHVHFLTQ